MLSYSGSCQCGDNQFELRLPKSLTEYTTRRCDCDFCTSRHIEYISDPKAQLILSANSLEQFMQQGSNQARFLTCQTCHDVFAVVYQASPHESQGFGAINYNCLHQAEKHHTCQTVSPKELGAEEKTSRWAKLWCPIKLADLQEQ